MGSLFEILSAQFSFLWGAGWGRALPNQKGLERDGWHEWWLLASRNGSLQQVFGLNGMT